MNLQFRLKNADELIADGFAKTPNGDYVHARAETLTSAMMQYAAQFDDALIAVIMATKIAKYIDAGSHIYNYCPEHFIEIPRLRLINE